MLSPILVVIITIFIPPLGVFLIKGCGADVIINIALTILGYFPGHIHAFYLEYKYYKARDRAQAGVAPAGYSDNAYGAPQPGYGTVGTTPAQRV